MFYTERESEMTGFKLNGDDVACTGISATSNFGLGNTFKVSALAEAAKNWVAGVGSNGHANPHVKWFTEDGIKCEVLRSQGGGWKKGKFVFRLEFIPDDPEGFLETTIATPTEPPSPLSDLRTNLDI